MKYCFVDANILVFSCIRKRGKYDLANEALEDLIKKGFSLTISDDVLTEFIRGALKGVDGKQVTRAEIDETIRQVQFFRAHYRVLPMGAHVLNDLLAMYSQKIISGRIVYDAKIVACMLANGISHILTDNQDDFKPFEQEVSIIPLKSYQKDSE